MKYRFPAALKKSPFIIFEKVEKPIYLLIILSTVLLRGWMFGKSGKEFDILLTISGVMAVCAISALAFFLSGGRKLSQLSRFLILYSAFVPCIRFAYIKRLMNPDVLTELRADLYPEKLKNVIALWFPDFTGVLVLIVPFAILLGMAMMVNLDDIEKRKKIKRFILIVFIASVVLMMAAFPLANISNLCIYIMNLLMVSLIWKMWEIIRNKKSYEPASIVAWAEILLFVALWLKGIAESFL